MHKNDADTFTELINASMGVYQINVSLETRRIWWLALARYPIEAVREAFGRHIQDTKVGRFPPKPADIIAVLDDMTPDGRPGADEAWAMIPRDEHASVVMTNEMAEAMRVATPLLNEGDQVAARMAFKQAYERIVGENKRAGIAPQWFPSLGHDPQGREQVLKQAAERGLLPKAHVEALLPAPISPVINQVANLMLENKAAITPEQKQAAKKRLQEIKAQVFGTPTNNHICIIDEAVA